MFHCHNLVHEDNEFVHPFFSLSTRLACMRPTTGILPLTRYRSMMVAMNVTALEGWGYDNTTHLIDPMDSRFTPRPISGADFSQAAIQSRIDFLWNTDAYLGGQVPPSAPARRMVM